MGGNDKNDGLVIIIEDDRGIRKLLTSTLINNHFSVLAADSGREAIGLIKKHSKDISVIIMDLNLSDINGIDVIKKIKSLIADKHLVITTGLSVDVPEGTFPDMKVTYFKKPYDIDELVNVVSG